MKNWRRFFMLLMATIVIMVAIPEKVEAGPPGPPSRFKKVRSVKYPKCKTIGTSGRVLKICPKPVFGPFVKIRYKVGGKAWRWKLLYFSGQGGGCHITHNAYVRCKEGSCRRGKVVIYKRVRGLR